MANRINAEELTNQIQGENLEVGVFSEESKKVEINQLIALENLNRLKDDNAARKNFSDLIFTVTVIWMFAILFIVLLCGMGRIKLSNEVLITLITTATANVFGFFYVVVNYLFNKEKST